MVELEIRREIHEKMIPITYWQKSFFLKGSCTEIGRKERIIEMTMLHHELVS